jgi:folylpolyglutamate synthase/dihydropteroate synthase
VLAAWVRRAEVIEDHVCFDVRHPSEAFPALAKRIAHQIAELKARVHH